MNQQAEKKTVKIKICGLKSKEDILCINQWKPDYAGFVFCHKSSRYLSPEKAGELSRQLRPEIIPVGVFLDNPLEEILEVAESKAIQVLQIHGQDAPELVKSLKERTGIPVWEAIQVRRPEDIEKAKASLADLVLLDHGLGGTGQSFDWSLLNGLDRPFFLAGGLNPDNIRQALECKPYGVDVSSGVETEKRKDPEKIREFITKVRG